MPIGTITQDVSTIPAPPHRGVDVQTQFVIKQEDFQDHLAGTTIDELNTLKEQFNSRIGEINSTATTINNNATTATTQAGIATTKASEASASAALTANKVTKVTSTDNAIVRFNGTTGDVQNSSVVMDDSGNVGIGVTPSASTLPTIQSQYNMLAGQDESNICVNAYYSGGGFKYIANGHASRLYQNKTYGAYQFLTAPSGTAGSTIAWTTAMTLISNGNLLVGTTVDNGVDKLQVKGSISSGTIKLYSSGDLNDFKYITQTIGTYPSESMSNTPIDDHGYLEIIVYLPNVYVMQRFTTLGVLQTAGRVFVRCLAQGTWTAWAEK